MSEVQALFARRLESASPATRRLPGGTPVSATAEVRVRDPDSARLLGIGASGELEVRGPQGTVRESSYDPAFGLLLWARDSQGMRERNRYDALDRELK